MERKQLGRSTLEISRIGFGCMSLHPGYENNENLLQQAVELGINYFDTSDLYNKGENEMLVGKALKPFRDKVIIATKVGNQWRADGSGWDWNPSKAYILASVDKSLQRLQTDYIDLYQLHGGTIDDPIDETIEAFEKLVEQGKIRYYGISSIRPNVIREYINRSNIISVMTQYSLLDRRPEESTLNLLKENNIGVLARGTVASGLLVDKPAKDYLEHSKDAVEKAANAVRNLSGDKRTVAQTAIRFALQHPAITSAVVGIRNEQQLLEAANTLSSLVLEADDIETLKKAVPPKNYKEHR